MVEIIAGMFAVFLAGDVAGMFADMGGAHVDGTRRALETAAGARQSIGFAALSRKVRLRGLEYGERGGGSERSGSIVEWERG